MNQRNYGQHQKPKTRQKTDTGILKVKDLAEIEHFLIEQYFKK